MKKSDKSSSSGTMEMFSIAFAESVRPRTDSLSEESSSTSLTTESSFSSESSSYKSSQVSGSLFTELDNAKDTEALFGYESLRRTMSLSRGPKLNALDYFHSNDVFHLFTFLMTHLLAHTPEDPVNFLINLVDRCLRYRDEGADPPLVFEDSHVLSVYTALDPLSDGSITYKQYLAGMNTLGLTQFNIMPEGLVGRKHDVPKDVFLHEAKMALLEQLDRMLGGSHTRPSEEVMESPSTLNLHVYEVTETDEESTNAINTGETLFVSSTYEENSNEDVNSEKTVDQNNAKKSITSFTGNDNLSTVNTIASEAIKSRTGSGSSVNSSFDPVTAENNTSTYLSHSVTSSKHEEDSKRKESPILLKIESKESSIGEAHNM